MIETSPEDGLSFETHPRRYRHLHLRVDGPIARIELDVQEDEGLSRDYQLKLNSYDLGVDIELCDAVNRLRFEHPEVGAVLVTSAQEGVFSAGANIFMLGSSSHSFKVNFCKFTNETRLAMEEASRHSGQIYVAGLNGIASGGGYELALACEEIYLVDDRRSAAALPEVPYLGVLPGTGGLTRVVDKRKVRRDRADLFCTLAEGVKGKRAKSWGLVDDVFPSSRFSDAVLERLEQLAGDGHPDRKGVELRPLEPTVDDAGVHYRHVELLLDESKRMATLRIAGPVGKAAIERSSDWYPLRMFRELDDALLRLRFCHRDIGLVLLETRGDIASVLELDQVLFDNRDDWFVREVLLHAARVLKRVDVTAKSFFALVDEGSCFAGSLFELALAADRSYGLDAEGVEVALSALNGGLLPMGNGLSRLHSRLLAEPQRAGALLEEPRRYAVADAEERGLLTVAMDDIDWEDDLRLAVEERASLSPDALTGMEASLRFAGPETLETKIFGRLSAWQNWIFQRPNAVGERGALTLYGRPESPQFDWQRT